jgi:hypothetical protein
MSNDEPFSLATLENLIQVTRWQPLPFAFVLGKTPEKCVLGLHRTKESAALF